MEQKFEAVHGGLGTKYQTIFYLITPTRVGKTQAYNQRLLIQQKHPHACGEDLHEIMMNLYLEETPQRVWGRPK